MFDVSLYARAAREMFSTRNTSRLRSQGDVLMAYTSIGAALFFGSAASGFAAVGFHELFQTARDSTNLILGFDMLIAAVGAATIGGAYPAYVCYRDFTGCLNHARASRPVEMPPQGPNGHVTPQ